MTYSPFLDPKFLVALLDVVISLVLYFLGKYAGASVLADAKTVILALQPIALALIVGYLQRDQVAIKAGQPLAFLKK